MLQFAIPCLLGLESLVGDEVKKLGLADVKVENGRVLCRGEERDLARLNINLRCGARVLLVLASFRATDFETLFQGTRAVRWEDWIPREGEFPVTGYSINSTLHSVPACQSIVKKAVVERLGAAYGLQTLPETGKRYQIRFSIMKDEVMLCLDASGEGLYKRGYRAVGVAAPLKETLAAAMVKLSHYNGRDPFCDPFCGSGTIAIEAALIARNRAPGLNRSFAAQHWAMVDKRIWLDAADEAMDNEFHDKTYEICGGEHLAECSADRLLDGEGIGLACPETSELCCFIGEEYAVERALEQLQITAEKQSAQGDAPEAFTDTVIMYEVLSELKEIAARPRGITCACGSERYRMQVRPAAVDLICEDCGAKLRIGAATDEDLDRLCCRMTLQIPGKKG